MDNSNYELVAGEIKRHIESEVAELHSALKATPSFRNMASRVPSAAAQVDGVAARELQRVSAELRLVVAANKQKQERGSSSTHVFNGPIGLVQTGAGSIGFSSQHLDSGAKEALERAMDSLFDALNETTTDHDPRLAEVRELAAETKVEVAKPKPNLTKLKSLVAGIGSAISFTPKLKGAYDTVKWAAALIGVTLP